jgi:hypothetical protein
MRVLLFISLLFYSIIGFGQNVDTCFTQEEIQDISFTLDSLYALDSLNKQIISEQDFLIAMMNRRSKLDSTELAYRTRQIELLNQNIELYVRREKELQPKWYDNKVIWFASGIATTLLTGRFIILSVYGSKQ